MPSHSRLKCSRASVKGGQGGATTHHFSGTDAGGPCRSKKGAQKVSMEQNWCHLDQILDEIGLTKRCTAC